MELGKHNLLGGDRLKELGVIGKQTYLESLKLKFRMGRYMSNNHLSMLMQTFEVQHELRLMMEGPICSLA